MNESLALEIAPHESSLAVEAVSRAEINMQIATARQYPRKELSLIKRNMLSHATLDEETAAACFYKLPRGGSMIEGPSVRLAEIAASNYGNLRIATRTLETVTEGNAPHVVVQVAIHDLENNLAIQVEKRRRITGKKSKGGKPDEDDINLATNSCASIAFRDAVFRVVPNVLIRPVLDECKKVAVGKANSLSEKRTTILKRLAQLGASEARVLKSLGLAKAEDITITHCEDMIGRGTAIRDGALVEDVFPIDEATPTPAPAPKQAAPTPAPAPAPKAEAPAPATTASEDSVPMEGQTPLAKASQQGELEQLVTEAGFTFDQLLKWGTDTGNIPDGDTLASFDELHEATVKRLLRNKVGLLAALKREFSATA